MHVGHFKSGDMIFKTMHLDQSKPSQVLSGGNLHMVYAFSIATSAKNKGSQYYILSLDTKIVI